MREKSGVLLTILIGALLSGACGNQESVPASVAELEAVPIKQAEDGNGVLPEGQNWEKGSLGTVDEASESSGGNSASNVAFGGMEENITSNGASGSGEGNRTSNEAPGSSKGNDTSNRTSGSSAGNGVPNGTSENSGQNGFAGTASGDNGQVLPAGGQAEGGVLASGENLNAAGGGTLPAGELQPEEVKITISVAGDVTLGNYIGQGYEISFRQTYDKGAGDSYFFENVVDIFSEDDLTLVNLEGPLTRSEDFREGQTYCISGDPEYVNILTAGSVEAVSMANNHRLDYKEQGTADTVEALEGAGILYAYDNNYCMYETGGIRIGIVSVNEVGQGAGVEKYLQDGIVQLREDGADLVFACCHWGIEREYYPEDYQESLGKKCIDWGYDLVIGHHPHVLQGIEEYQGKYIIYSLGNFCFGANRNPPDKDTMIFQQTFTFRDGEKQEDKDIRVIPCSVSSVTSRNDYKPTPAEGEEAQRILDKINEYSRDFGVEFDSDGYLSQ